MTATLYRRDTSLATPNCAVATNYSGAKSLKAWYTANASHPAGATAPAIDSGTALGTSVPGSANVSLTFTAGVASFNLTTSDVGKFSLNLRDDTRSFANAVNIDSKKIEREPASELDPDSDLGKLLVTTEVGKLTAAEKAAALENGVKQAEGYLAKGLIAGAVLMLQGECRVVGAPVAQITGVAA